MYLYLQYIRIRAVHTFETPTCICLHQHRRLAYLQMGIFGLSDPPNGDKQNLSDPRQEPGYRFWLCNTAPPNKEALYTANMYKISSAE